MNCEVFWEGLPVPVNCEVFKAWPRPDVQELDIAIPTSLIRKLDAKMNQTS